MIESFHRPFTTIRICFRHWQATETPLDSHLAVSHRSRFERSTITALILSFWARARVLEKGNGNLGLAENARSMGNL